MSVREYAEQLAEDIHGESILALDPLTILAIIQAIAAIVSLWKNCKPSAEFSPDDMREYLTSGGPLRKQIRSRQMQRAIRRDLTEEELELLGTPEVFVHHMVRSADKHKATFDAAYAEVIK